MKDISIFHQIGNGERLDEVEDGDIQSVCLNGLEGCADPIATIRLYRKSRSAILRNILKGVFQEGPLEKDRVEICTADLYHPEDVQRVLGCPDDEYQIVSIGRNMKCDLRPVTKKWTEGQVSRYHCVVSLNTDTNHIQISDIGTTNNGSTHGTYVNGRKIVATTIPLEERDVVGIGRILFVDPTIHRVEIGYELSPYGRSIGINQPKEDSQEPSNGLELSLLNL